MNLEEKLEAIGEVKFQKIASKLCSIAITKLLLGQRPYVTIKEMKHLISCYKLKKQNWFAIVRGLEQLGVLKYSLHSGFVVVKMPAESLLRIYSLKAESSSASNPSKHQHILASDLRKSKLKQPGLQ